jgi:MFS family permease
MASMKKNSHELKTVITCGLAIFVTMGMVDSQFPLYIKPIADDLALSRNAVSLLVSIKMITMTMMTLLIPGLHQKIGVKRVMLMGAIFVCTGLTGYATFNNIIALYGSAVFHGIGLASIIVGIPMIVNRSVSKNKTGKVTGIVYSLSGIGGMVTTPITLFLFSAIGWRYSMYISALAVIVLSIIPFNRYISFSYDQAYENLDASSEDASMQNKWHYKMPILGLVFVVITSAYTMSVVTHAPAHFAGLGFEPASIAVIVSMYNIIMAGGNILFGVLSDRIGIKKVAMLCSIFFVILCSLLVVMNSVWQGYVYGVLFGMAAPLIMVGIVLISISVIPESKYSTMWSRVVMLQTFTFASATWLNGFLFDTFGSYRIAFILCAITGFLTLLGLTVITQDRGTENTEHKVCVELMPKDKVV